MKLPKNFKMDSEGPRHVHECEDCKPLSFDKILEGKHTPTPWQQGTTVNRKAMDTIYTQNGELQICKVDTSCPEPGENEANAAFIVRAVNCYEEILKELKNYRNHASNTFQQPLLEYLNKLIAKAEGK